MSAVPIWVRVPLVMAVALVAIIVGSLWLGGAAMEGMDHTGPPSGPTAPAGVPTPPAGAPTPPHVRPSHP